MRPIFWVLLFLLAGELAAQDAPTYYRDVAPILERNCVTCHQKGQIGPMPLTGYDEVAAYGQMIHYVTAEKLMPPWLAEEPVGVFEDEKQLSEQEIDLLKRWLDAGMPPGDSTGIKTLLPPNPPFLTDPDTIFRMAESFEQYGVYYDQYRVFSIPTNLPEDRYVSHIEFVPGNPDIVRGAHISIDTGDKVVPLDEWDPQYGYFSFGELGFVPEESRWYNWYPGRTRTEVGPRAARLLPAGAKLLLHIHYGPTGVPQPDRSEIRLKFAEKVPDHLVRTLPLHHPASMTNDTFYLPAGERTRVHASIELPFPTRIYALQPHGHFLASQWQIFATLPEQRRGEVLLQIDEWDFHHKQKFLLRKPLDLPAGTLLHTLAEYDNTSENLFNPNDPPRAMHWGKRMYEEMFLVFFDLVPLNDPFLSGFQILSHPANVTGDQFRIKVALNRSDRLSVELFSFSGEIHQKISEKQKFSAGVREITIPVGGLVSGNYYVRISDKAGRQVCVPFYRNVGDDFRG